MAFEQIRYDAAGGVATITLNRPEKLNAVTAVLIRELMAAFDAADDDDAVRAVIVTGAGRPSAPAPTSPGAPGPLTAPSRKAPGLSKSTATAAASCRSGSTT